MKTYSYRLLLAGIICLCLSSFAEAKEHEKNNRTVKVMSYNIHQGRGPAPAKTYDLKKIIRVINESGADIIGLNEVLNNWTKVTRNENQPDSIRKYCTAYPYAVYQASNTQTDGGTFGNMVLSKYPILSSHIEIYKDKNPEEAFPYKGFLEANIAVKGKTFKFYVTHFILPDYPKSQTGQIQQLIEHSKKTKDPKIVCGDLNFLPASAQHSAIVAEFSDPLGTSLAPATFSTNGYKNTRLDYILGKKVSFSDVNIWKNELTLIASDHFPLLATALIDF